jgi:5-methyltetrahydropteroyltriglutamate--homocysteine methyltransferase
MKTYAYGFPRLGADREYKKLIERCWDKEISESELRNGIDELEKARLDTYERYVDKFPVGEMTLYDNMLDTALMLGLYRCETLNSYYDLCNGKNALEMTKWFNTNYHYLVPDFASSSIAPRFGVVWNKPKQALEKHKRGTPYLIGPFTFLKLSKGIKHQKFGEYLLALADTYGDLIEGFDEVHIDEPAFVMELTGEEVELIGELYKKIGARGCAINLFTYYDSVDFLEDLYELPVEAIGLDFINGYGNLEKIKKHGFPEDKTLIAGVVNGRNVWRTDIKKSLETLKELSHYAGDVVLSNASPLYHLPVTIRGESLDERLLSRLSFAEERLYELKLLARAYRGSEDGIREWNESSTDFGVNSEVREKVSNLKGADFLRASPYPERVEKQREVLNLPLFPVSTIGSFPQTAEVRQKRAGFRAGRVSGKEYSSFVRGKISELIKLEEELGIDVLVHGEFERTDMVEFFAEKLDGIATTKKGWIISYGTRGYRPPIIYGDISRPNPMTTEEIAFAQSLTGKPVKGMLTGPVTMISWSFVREEIPISEVAYQIALCLQEEIEDYQRNGIQIVQIDEPAFRERAPIKRRDWEQYFDWATKSFRLSSSHAKPETQIQTHMCYSEFGEIISQIARMDFDVITIETSRSKGDIIEYFEKANFDRQIGLGVWDIHSPAIPGIDDMREVVRRALRVFPKENFWINPDCGLKTRRWEEVIPSLRNLVNLAGELRKSAEEI